MFSKEFFFKVVLNSGLCGKELNIIKTNDIVVESVA